MDARLDDAMAQAAGIRDDAILDLVGHDAAAAHDRKSDWRSLMLVRNRAAAPRGGIAELEIETFLADVAGRARAPRHRNALGTSASPRLAPWRRAGAAARDASGESAHRVAAHYPDNDLVEVRRVVAWVPAVAGYSVAPLAARRREEHGAAWPIHR